MKTRAALLALMGAASALTLAATASAQTAGGAVVVVTGTRVENRTALDTAVAVDVVSADALTQGGVSEVNQALSVVLPSYNFPRPGLADGTDTIRPATLRGLAPDQVLVLVNSKRRHTSALVNVNGTIGRGSAAVDLNAIPSAMIQSIEVLRDGASAQYGSDAIAGVINVRLRDTSEGGNATVSYGWRDSEYDVLVGTPAAGVPNPGSRISRKVEDGQTLTLSGWKGFSVPGDGSLSVGFEVKSQDRTERDGYDVRQNYPLLNGQPDPREATFDRFNAWTGEPELSQYSIMANGETNIAAGVKAYGWASYQFRDSRSAGFYRRAVDARNVIQIYPDGFLPIIHPQVEDYSAGVGLAWSYGAWDMDSSIVFGFNEMDFTIENTLNRSLGPTSPTEFRAGGFNYDQTVFNLSGTRGYDVGLASPLNVSLGLEARQESYQIKAGEPDSYITGTFGGAGGAQVFPGFQPSNVVNEDRTNVGVYADFEANFTERLLASFALRGESYSDFGETATGKLALRYDFTDAFALRASAQNGFRAPSLQQQFFTATSTNFINGVPFEIGTFPSVSPVARALGGQPLDSETSVNYSVGGVLDLSGFTLTVDAYQINVDNRIVLSENLTGTPIVNLLTAAGITNATGGRFFINGVDTETQGVDIVASFDLNDTAVGDFGFILGANFNDTRVTALPATRQLSTINPPPVLFARSNVLTFERGTPDSKFSGQVEWSLGSFGATLRATRYGEVLSPGTTAANDFLIDPATVVDLEGRFRLRDKVTFAIGADNLLDEYPDPLPPSLNTTGNTPYSNFAPFGRSGRFVYARVSYDF
ncbi:TonB-dependent receptor [bacterium]|nr:TonB-dependent receptor [bacterium]